MRSSYHQYFFELKNQSKEAPMPPTLPKLQLTRGACIAPKKKKRQEEAEKNDIDIATNTIQ